MSWLRQVRALPSNPASNDILKVEYLDVNLNNSRKLMANVANLGVEAKQLTQHEEDTVEAMLQLKNLRNELSWTDIRLTSLMRFLGRRRKPQPQPQPQLRKEAPREKLSTIYQLRNFGTNYKRQLDAVVEAVDKNVFLSRTVGLLLQGEHLQVTELAVKSLDMAEHPDRKIQIEFARLRNGFPMSHQLYGFGSEMKIGSIHDNVTADGGSLELKAEFKPPSWIRQEAYSRIVLPGMHVASFLPLSLQLVDEWSSNNKLQEPLHLTKIRVELQEFRCVPHRNFESTDIQRKVLVEQEVFMAIDLLNKKTMIPHTMYDCVIPEVGPTFFTDGFLRTYGLEVTLTISNGSALNFNTSVFIELNLAQEKFERINNKGVVKSLESYLGEGGEHPTHHFHLMKDLRDVESTANGLLALSRLNADESTGNPGMELSEFVKCALIVAQSFEEASLHHHVEDTEIQLEQIEIKLIEAKIENGKITREKTILLDNKDLPSIRWSDFKDTVAGSPKARAITLPQTLFKGNLPANLKPHVFCHQSMFYRGHLMDGRLLVRFSGQVYTFEWSYHLEVAENRM
ncbi:uncharacterized protein CXQ87_004540 [Candidozyma duobushaemuli]|uniref:Uncharacterized protein n=1 Tax=Candidozyma duobushaemuli TaxID=1231522 RepID=A0A2V1AH10_9ASCO|nr:uncharacterized protein CXQ87_004540 [[Candida] duobushaemulonis]PVH16982.1 hypothetical protein CXQ87_004540 [[Candida] duobushaemulonis]